MENLCDDGIIRITSNVVAVEGSVNVEPALFYNEIVDKENMPNYIKWSEWFTIGIDEKISTWAEPFTLDLKSSGTALTFDGGFTIPSNIQFQSWQYPIRDGVLYELDRDILGSTKLTITLKSGIPSGESTTKNWFELTTDDGALFDYSNYVDAMKQDTNFVVWVNKVGDVYSLLLDVVTVGIGAPIAWLGNATYPSAKIHNDISGIFPLDRVVIKNGVYDNLDITSNTSRAYSRTFPTWDYYTRINCNFSTLNGGNLDVVVSQLEGIKLKRRLRGTFDWITLNYISVTDEDSLSFIHDDYMCPTDKTFDYAIVPILSGGVEGDYIINTVTSSFDGCFVCDASGVFKMYSACTYPTSTNSLTAGVITPIGRRYPILIYNTDNDYEGGTFSADLLGYGFEDNRTINRQDVQEQLTDYRACLKNKTAKILKDWDGRIKLIGITGGITETPDLINGKVNVGFSWVEQGQYDNQSDLYENGLVPTNG